MLVTRISYGRRLTAKKFSQLEEIASRLGTIRSVVWDEYGSLKGLGKSHREIRNFWVKTKTFGVQGKLWKETLRDSFENISAYKEAAKAKVRKAVSRREKDKKIRSEMYSALRDDSWVGIPFLHRQMRKHFRHGHTKVKNQIVLDNRSYSSFILNGEAWISVMGLVSGKRIPIPLNTNRVPKGTLRLLLKDGKIEVHHCVDAADVCVTRPCGPQTVGIDKGYTEAFTDSDGDRHGKGLGELLSSESDFLKLKYQRRNHLRAISEKSLGLGKTKKHQNIVENNLGRKKLNKRKKVHRENIRSVVFKAVHSVLDKASKVVSEDLSSPIKSKAKRSRDQKRRLSGWVKGLLASALVSASQRRCASLILVAAAYTSQMDSSDGTLTGCRKGDSFHRESGEVLDADWNAALNILARASDSEISLWTPFKEVKSILLRRTGQIKRLGLLNQDSSCFRKEINGERITSNLL